MYIVKTSKTSSFKKIQIAKGEILRKKNLLLVGV
jgi:hypothetical protein